MKSEKSYSFAALTPNSPLGLERPIKAYKGLSPSRLRKATPPKRPTMLRKTKKQNNMATINEKQDEVIEEFEGFTDWMDKYQMLIDLGNDLEPLDAKYKTEQNLIDGCQSRVWLQADYKDGLLYFTADSDALITKGIIALLIEVLSAQTPKDIADADLYFIDRIGLRDHLSPTRSNGLLAMVKQIKMYAVAYGMKG